MTWSIRTYDLADLFDGGGGPTPLLAGLVLPQNLQRTAKFASDAAALRGACPFLSNVARSTDVRGSSAWHFSDPKVPPATLTLVTFPWDLATLTGDDRFKAFDEALDELGGLPELRAAVGFAMARYARERKDSDLSDVLAHARSLGAYGTRVAEEP